MPNMQIVPSTGNSTGSSTSLTARYDVLCPPGGSTEHGRCWQCSIGSRWQWALVRVGTWWDGGVGERAVLGQGRCE